MAKCQSCGKRWWFSRQVKCDCAQGLDRIFGQQVTIKRTVQNGVVSQQVIIYQTSTSPSIFDQNSTVNHASDHHHSHDCSSSSSTNHSDSGCSDAGGSDSSSSSD
ncbi:hypothetical protein [Acinetobacter larvae]|uniref:Uncharacterized protein n=1 Tax=Acinetobacter larvae TaxID=1789224 RepID=A0A1B2M070_9GAMM|nr:hypothetical protein [Acinetobacter larvae]AOA58561.1 hypothetical protein BFG52_09485 [Acinetobacter larvae]